ncbi:MAG: TIGR00289 family protein [Candidatus Aenigmatarchaeota archaeon]
MKLIALFSGGKDSTYAIFKALKEGHTIEYLATVHSRNPESFMYHTANIGLTVFQAESMGMRLVSSECLGEKEKEVHELENLLKGTDAEAVLCGAIRSAYQKNRIVKVCKSLNLKLLAPLWHVDEEKYLRELVASGFKVIITEVAADGFDESWLGREIDEACINGLLELKKKHKISIVGEGGEYETAVLDCPLFRQRIEITKAEKAWKGASGRYVISAAKLVPKS